MKVYILVLIACYVGSGDGGPVYDMLMRSKRALSTNTLNVKTISADIHRYPFMVSIQLTSLINDIDQCDGTILNALFVLTAAHCLTNVTEIRVSVGSSDINKGTIYSTKKYHIHPKYNDSIAEYDAGIIQLGTAMKLDGTTSKAVNLANANTKMPTGSKVTIVWWQVQNVNQEEMIPILHEETMPVDDYSICENIYDLEAGLQDQIFCAGDMNPKDPNPCEEDYDSNPGGPALDSSGTQVGIVAVSGDTCGKNGIPTLLNYVSPYRSWIKSIAGV